MFSTEVGVRVNNRGTSKIREREANVLLKDIVVEITLTVLLVSLAM